MTVQLGGSWHLQKSSVKSNAEANGGFYVLALLHVRQSIGELIYIFRVSLQIPSESSTELNQHSPDVERRLFLLLLAFPKAASPRKSTGSDTSQH